MKKKILVVGGEGYIGQILCKNFLENNYEIISYDNLIYKQNNNKESYKNPYYKFINADISDKIYFSISTLSLA